MTDSRFEFRRVRTIANVKNQEAAEFEIVEVCVKDKEEGHLVGQLPFMPARHYVVGISDRFWLIQVRLHKYLVERVVPPLTLIARTHRVTAAIGHQSRGNGSNLLY
jgi:hypothetical protein